MSVLARCLVDAAYLQSLSSLKRKRVGRNDSERDSMTHLDALDLQRLRLFSGFITRVQHNFLWEELPGTIGLLRLYHVELRFFAEYAVHHQLLRARNASKTQRIYSFVKFLEDLLQAADGSAYPGLIDVLRYEWATWLLRRTDAPPRIPQREITWTSMTSDEWRRVVPVFRIPIAVCTHSVDPVAAVRHVDNGRTPPVSASEEQSFRLYWYSATRELRMADVDAGLAALVQSIDGYRSAQRVVRHAAAAIKLRFPIAAARIGFMFLINAGLLTARKRSR